MQILSYNGRSMIIGIPKELKPGERRVSLTPTGCKELTNLGHIVVVEKSAGHLSGYSDQEYKKSGAQIVNSGADVWEGSELLVKVKEPEKRRT